MTLSKGHLGSREGKHLKLTERHQFHLSSDKHHSFKYISYACAGRIFKVLDMNSISILYSLAILLFEN